MSYLYFSKKSKNFNNLSYRNKYKLERRRRYYARGCFIFTKKDHSVRNIIFMLAKFYRLNIKRLFLSSNFLLKRKFLGNRYLKRNLNRFNLITIPYIRHKNPIYTLSDNLLLNYKLFGFITVSKFRFYKKNLFINLKLLPNTFRNAFNDYFYHAIISNFKKDLLKRPIKFSRYRKLVKLTPANKLAIYIALNFKRYLRTLKPLNNYNKLYNRYSLINQNFSIVNSAMILKKRMRTNVTGFLSRNLHKLFFFNHSRRLRFKISRQKKRDKRIIFLKKFDYYKSKLRYQKSRSKYINSFYRRKFYNTLTLYNNVHYKEIFKIRKSFSSIKYLARFKYVNSLVNLKYRKRSKFPRFVIKTRSIRINNKLIRNSSFYYQGSFMKKIPYLSRSFIVKASLYNRRKLRKKNWKFTKLNAKRHSARSFLKRSLFFGFFKKQDSFRILHIFRTIFLKYSFGYHSFNLLKYFKRLKNSLINTNVANTFVDRFLWQIERTSNILVFRGRYVPNIKTANHLIRYGFFMLNNKLINNPYTQVSLFDVLRVSKTKYFLKLFLRDYLVSFGFRKRNNKPLYIEINPRVLALTVFRKPTLEDFILNKTVVSPKPETSWYLALPTISALF